MQHSVERFLCHHVRSLCLVDHLRTERKGGHPCLFLVHLPDRLHQLRGEQGRRPPVVRHQIDQSVVEVGNVSGLVSIFPAKANRSTLSCSRLKSSCRC